MLRTAVIIVFRGLVYLPFALLLGIALKARPSLLPYLAGLHIALDAMAAMMMFGSSEI